MPVVIGDLPIADKNTRSRVLMFYVLARMDLMEFIDDLNTATLHETYLLWLVVATPNPASSKENADLNALLEPIVRARLDARFNILVGPDKPPKKEKVS